MRVPRLREMIIYELCPREFVDPAIPYAHPSRASTARGPGRVLRAITARIRSGYFERLGVNTLELMPVLASAWTDWERARPERDPWGYLPLSWYALNGDYGSPADLAALVDAAHERGLAVLLDVSVDHGYGGQRHGLITDLWPAWRRPDPRNPWGLLELRIERPDVQRFVGAALERLLRVYNVDGFRMDWTERVPWRVWKPLLARLRRIKPDAVFVSENPVRDHVARGGFDGAWDFFFHWEAPLLLRRVYRNYDGYARKMVDTQDKLVENLTRWARGPHAPPGPLVRYIESHDLPRVARPRVKWQHGGDQLLDVDGDGKTPDWLEHGGPTASRLGADLLAVVPGAVLLFAGQEFGASDPLHWRCDPLDWSRQDEALRAHYSARLKLRAASPSLRSDDLTVLLNDSGRHLLALARGTAAGRGDDDRFVAAYNFGPCAQTVTLTLPAAGSWSVVDGARVVTTTREARLELAPFSATLLRRGAPKLTNPGR